MQTTLDSLIYWIGALVCLSGGVGLLAIASVWALDKAVHAFGVYNVFREWIFDVWAKRNTERQEAKEAARRA